MRNRRKLLIVGSRGFVGGHLRASAEPSFDLCSDDLLDITNQPMVDEAVRSVAPGTMVLLAAISDIDRCEREPELAERVNTDGAINVARACERYGARLIFTSTGAVFDGRQKGYTELDERHPLSMYGVTKARAEAAIESMLPSAVIVRLPLVVGFGLRDGTNSLVDKLLESLQARRPVPTPVDEFRNPIDVGTLAAFLIHFANTRELGGIFHVGASDYISRHELARKLAFKTGHPEELVTRGGSDAPGRAPRGRHQFLISDKASLACGIPLPTVDEVIERILRVLA